MNATELKQAGFSDQEIQGYNFKQAGFSDKEINQHFKPSLLQRTKDIAGTFAGDVVEGYKQIFSTQPESPQSNIQQSITTKIPKPETGVKLSEVQKLQGTSVLRKSESLSHGQPLVKKEIFISEPTPTRELTPEEQQYATQAYRALKEKQYPKKGEIFKNKNVENLYQFALNTLPASYGMRTFTIGKSILAQALEKSIKGAVPFGYDAVVRKTAEHIGANKNDLKGLLKDVGFEAAYGALFNLMLSVPSFIRQSNWWRMLDNPERGLVTQTVDQLKKAGFKDAEIAKMNKSYWQKLFEERKTGEIPIKTPIQEPEAGKIPEHLKGVTGEGKTQAEALIKETEAMKGKVVSPEPLPPETSEMIKTNIVNLQNDITRLEKAKSLTANKDNIQRLDEAIKSRQTQLAREQAKPEGALKGEEFKLATEEGRGVIEPAKAMQKGLFEKEGFMDKLTPEEAIQQAKEATTEPVTRLAGEQELPLEEKITKERKPLRFDPETHTFLTLLRQEGGLDYLKEHRKGELDVLRETKHGKFLVNKQGKGITLDRALRLAQEHRFLGDEAGLDDVYDLIYRSAQGEKIYSFKADIDKIYDWDKIELEAYSEPLGGEGGFVGIGKNGETVLDLSQIADKDLSYTDWLRVSPHVVDKHPYMKQPIYTAIATEQDMQHAIQTTTEKVTQLFDKVEPLSILGKIVGRRRSNLEGIQDMVRGEIPVTEKYKEFVNEQKDLLETYKQRIIVYKKEKLTSHLSPKQKEYLDFLEGKTTERPKYVRKGTVNAVNEVMKEYKNLEKWGLTDYFPEVFKGQYKIVHSETGTIIGSGETAKQAEVNALANIEEQHPEWAKDKFIATNDFIDLIVLRKTINPELAGALRYLGTSLSRKEYGTLIGKITKSIKDELPNLKSSEINIDLRGIARIKPSAKWSGHLMEKKTTLKGDYQDPYRQLISYIVSIERKLAIEPAKKALYNYADNLPPTLQNAKQYIKDMADDLAGRYDITNKIIDGTIGKLLGSKPFLASRWLSKGTSIEAKLKLGYAPVKAEINRIGGFAHTAIKESINYTVKGRLAIRTPEGKVIIEAIRQRIGMEQPFTTGGVESFKAITTAPFRPLGWYNKQEMINRPEAFMATYLRAKNKGLPKEEAINMAIETAQLTQGLYNTMALPALIRKLGPIGKAGWQFKQYIGNDWRFMSSLTAGQWAKYIPYIITMGGTRGALLLIKSVIGISLIGIGIDELADKLNKKIPHLHRGIFGLVGFDVSAPATWQIPSRITDWIAPLFKDSYNTGKMIMEGFKNGGWTDEEINDYFQSIAPVAYNVWQGIEMLTTGVIKEGTKKIYQGKKAEGIINLAGARTVEQSQASDLARHELQQKARLNKLIDIQMDNFFKAVDKNDSKEINNTLYKLAELKGIQTPEDIQTLRNSLINSWKERQLTQQQRIFKGLPKNLKRQEFQELFPARR